MIFFRSGHGIQNIDFISGFQNPHESKDQCFFEINDGVVGDDDFGLGEGFQCIYEEFVFCSSAGDQNVFDFVLVKNAADLVCEMMGESCE